MEKFNNKYYQNYALKVYGSYKLAPEGNSRDDVDQGMPK